MSEPVQCAACGRRIAEENLAISEIRSIFGVGSLAPAADLPKRVLKLRRQAERSEELTDFRLQVLQLTTHIRRHPEKLDPEKIADGLDALLSGSAPDFLQ